MAQCLASGVDLAILQYSVDFYVPFLLEYCTLSAGQHVVLAR